MASTPAPAMRSLMLGLTYKNGVWLLSNKRYHAPQVVRWGWVIRAVAYPSID